MPDPVHQYNPSACQADFTHMEGSKTVEIRKLRDSEIEEAAKLLSRGMRDNPINIAAFGVNPMRRQEALARFFRVAMQGTYKRGSLLGAFKDAALIGICGMTPPCKCQPSVLEKLWMLPVLLVGNSPKVPLRVSRWVGEWSRRDPDEPHWHLGPVAVDAHHRSRGIGGALVAAFCARVDDTATLAYLETDKKENIPFYERYGFSVQAEGTVLGVPNWFMKRSPRKGK
jgi:ribosomal protein S18 acetylase RimI-like enzyme